MVVVAAAMVMVVGGRGMEKRIFIFVIYGESWLGVEPERNAEYSTLRSLYG